MRDKGDRREQDPERRDGGNSSGPPEPASELNSEQVGHSAVQPQNSPSERAGDEESNTPAVPLTPMTSVSAHPESTAGENRSEAVQSDSPEEVTSPTVALEYKHPLAIRWMHWINFPLLVLMIYSGILIYWADSQHEGLNAHRYYRVGWGDWTAFRLFPDWFYSKLHLEFQLANGLGYHFFFMWFFALNGLAYVLYTIFSGEWRYLVPNRQSFKEAIQVFLHDVGVSKYHPPRRKFNGAQQFAYSGVILMGVGSLLTGLAIYKPTQLHVLTSLLGGYEIARWLHFWLTIAFVGFFLIHVAQVIRAGWNNFRSMIIGYELVPSNTAANSELHHGQHTSGQRA
jgi:thiosulfate reductase cytochrome b subunit